MGKTISRKKKTPPCGPCQKAITESGKGIKIIKTNNNNNNNENNSNIRGQGAKRKQHYLQT